MNVGVLQKQRAAPIIGSEMGSRESVLNHTGKGGESESWGGGFFWKVEGNQLISAREMGESSNSQIVQYRPGQQIASKQQQQQQQ